MAHSCSCRLSSVQFTHIFVTVCKTETGAWRINVFTKNTVPSYGPALPYPPEFTDSAELRRFLLTKLFNGEKAALASPTAIFAQNKERTIAMLLKNIHETYAKASRRVKASPKMDRKYSSRRESFASDGQVGGSLDLTRARVVGTVRGLLPTKLTPVPPRSRS